MCIRRNRNHATKPKSRRVRELSSTYSSVRLCSHEEKLERTTLRILVSRFHHLSDALPSRRSRIRFRLISSRIRQLSITSKEAEAVPLTKISKITNKGLILQRKTRRRRHWGTGCLRLVEGVLRAPAFPWRPNTRNNFQTIWWSPSRRRPYSRMKMIGARRKAKETIKRPRWRIRTLQSM